MRLANAWMPYTEEIKIIKQSGGIEQATLSEWVSGMLRWDSAENQNTELISALNSMVSFFDAIDICVQNKLCDEPILEKYFSDPARALHQLYGPAIKDLRKNLSVPTFGRGLDSLAERWSPSEPQIPTLQPRPEVPQISPIAPDQNSGEE